MNFRLNCGLFISFLIVGCTLFPGTNSTPLPPVVTTAPAAAAYDSLAALMSAATAVPAQDSTQLAAELLGVSAPTIARTSPPALAVGDVANYWVTDLESNGQRQITAVLGYRSDGINMWVDRAVEFDAAQLAEAAVFLETELLPAVRERFGTELQPGIDGDTRLNILHVAALDGQIAAYFSPGNQVVTAVNPFSNEQELLVISLAFSPLASDDYYATIAHEMQHLIQWRTDANEEAWLGEGLSELAAHLSGYRGSQPGSYVNQPDIQLNSLRYDDTASAHYAAAFLFSSYFYDRFGPDALLELLQEPANGLAGLDAVLQTTAPALSGLDLFADWLVANYAAGNGRSVPPYQYQSLALPALTPMEIDTLPARETAVVNQFGADYYRLQHNQPVTFVFTGTRQIPLVDSTAHSGDFVWATLPADGSNQTLTRRFDLAGLTQATLTFWHWYEIESGWDYAYLSVSTDNGRSWQLLNTDSSSQENPNGNSYGPAYSGRSGDGGMAAWTQETADLSPYSGQEIQLRFQYITDGAIHDAGWLLDDIAIPELGYFENSETDDGSWQTAGFARTGLVLPQSFLVQQILLSDNEMMIERIPLNNAQQGQWTVPMSATTNEVIIIIAATTPFTRFPATYQFSLN